MRLLIAIGCDRYEVMSVLGGAEADAKGVHERLVTRSGAYDVDGSVLLLSPDLEEMRTALASLDKAVGVVETLTFFYAGHGCYRQGAYFLTTRDTDPSRLPSTSIAMDEVLRSICFCEPREVNIVVDACNAGGAGYDFNRLQRADVIEQKRGMSISFFGACGSKQYAADGDTGGLATTALLRFVDGKLRVQDSREYLGLVEIGQEVATSAEFGDVQQPVVWCINKTSPGVFTQNPFFKRDSPFPVYAVDGISPDSKEGLLVAGLSERIRKDGLEVGGEWDTANIHCSLHAVAREIHDVDSLYLAMRGVQESLRTVARSSRDLFAELDHVAVCGLMSLRDACRERRDARGREWLLDWLKCCQRAALELSGQLEQNRFALVLGGASEYHYLPIRVIKIVGVLSAAKLVSRLIGEPASEAVDHALATVLALYADGLVAVSDEQAAGIALLAAATKGEELQGWSQLAVMNLTATAAILKGRVLGLHASPEDALDYTMTKVGMAKSSDPRILAQPSQLLFALFVACKALGMREVPDKMMVAFDRRPIGCFVPDSYLQYHDPQMVMGRNVVQYIGEGMFTVEDFERGFLSEVSQSEERALSELSAVDLAWPVIASAILGDRMPPTSLALST